MGQYPAYKINMVTRVASEESLDYKELQSDWVLLNCVFDTYRSFMPFLKLMHHTLDSCLPHRDLELLKQYPDGLDSDISEDNLVGEAE